MILDEIFDAGLETTVRNSQFGPPIVPSKDFEGKQAVVIDLEVVNLGCKADLGW